MNKNILCLLILFFFCQHPFSYSQPAASSDGVKFQVDIPQARTLSLIGDFNGWSQSSDPMMKDSQGKWIITKKLPSGTYQYAFLVDGSKVLTDPANEVSIQDAERRQNNSVFTLASDGGVLLQGYPERLRLNDDYPKRGGIVYLNLIWRYHQPMYYDVEKDQVSAPFVRIHATKDYYDMAATVEKKSNVHVTATLSPSLLWQIENIYVNRMEPYAKQKVRKFTFDTYGFQARFKGRTDPWIDLCLKSASQFTEEDKNVLYKGQWNAFTISPVEIERFPQFNTLYEKWKDAQGNPNFTEQEIRSLKFWAIFAHFDPEFYERKIPLSNKYDVDFRDLVSFRSDGRYYLKQDVTEDDCQRIIGDVYKVMASIVPKYEKIKYNPRTKAGQIELAGTSYFDAALPLLINSDVAKESSPNSTLPMQYKHPEDAETQIQLSQGVYNQIFTYQPRVYVPPMGTISSVEIPILIKNGYKWFAADQSVLTRSEPSGFSMSNAYTVKENTEMIGGVFGDTELSDRVYYMYRNYYAENAADDFIRYVLSFASENPAEDKLVTVVLEGETPWTWYKNDIDGQGFVNGIYRKLDALFKSRAIVTTTVSEYFDGNLDRGVRAHQLPSLQTINKLASGSKLNGNFNSWIGDRNSNTAWEYVNQVKNDLQTAGVNLPAGDISTLREGSKELYAARAYMSLLAALGSDWFLKFSNESILKVNPKPYETIFLKHLKNAYTLAQQAGITVQSPALEPFITSESAITVGMNTKNKTRVTFHCTLKDREAITAVYIAGSRPELADLQPNTQRMWDNGEYGDAVSGDNIWTLVVDIDQGALQYKFTNSGGKGTWEGSEAFPDKWRRIEITGEKMTVDDIFGNLTGQK